MKSPVRAALALGSGGARGFAHIGAIQVLEDSGFEIVAVAGTSIGALIGGLYAAHKLDEYTEHIKDLSNFDLLRLIDVSVSAPGMIRAEKIFAHVHELIGDTLIEELPVSFTAVATDLFARKAVWFQRGPLEVAMRASIAIPGAFTPVMLNGRLLVDGGLMDPLPIASVAGAQAEVTIAIDLGGERSGMPSGAPAKDTTEERPIDEWIDRFRNATAYLTDRELVRSAINRFGTASSTSVPATQAEQAAPEQLPNGLRTFDVMIQSLETMQSVLTRYRLADNPPDLLVTVPKDACRTLDFRHASEMIELGRMLTTEALNESGLRPTLP